MKLLWRLLCLSPCLRMLNFPRLKARLLNCMPKNVLSGLLMTLLRKPLNALLRKLKGILPAVLKLRSPNCLSGLSLLQLYSIIPSRFMLNTLPISVDSLKKRSSMLSLPLSRLLSLPLSLPLSLLLSLLLSLPLSLPLNLPPSQFSAAPWEIHTRRKRHQKPFGERAKRIPLLSRRAMPTDKRTRVTCRNTLWL